MAAKYGLGKGLDALLGDLEPNTPPDSTGETTTAAIKGSSDKLVNTGELYLPLDKIRPNPNQPRQLFDETALHELADSIREHGVIQPIIVENDGSAGYLIVAGERRCRAARLAGLTTIPAVIRGYGLEGRMEAALIENVQRENLNPVEEANAYQQLMELTDLSQEAVAARVGKKRSTVANALRLLKLPEEMLNALAAGDISSGHGRAILSVINPANRLQLFQRIIEESCSVREAERFADELNAGGRTVKKTTAKQVNTSQKSPDVMAIEQKFIESLGTKVVISGGLKKGSIKIDYYSMDDLDRIYSILAGNSQT